MHPSVKAVVDNIAQHEKVEKIILYGSRARGDNTERSDIDIAISCPEAKGWDWFDIKDLADEAPTLLEIDMVNIDEISEELKNDIDKYGIIVYERRKN